MKKKKQQKRILAILIALIVILGGVAGFLGYMYKTENETAVALKEELDANTLTVYVASQYIAGGDTITADGDNPNVIQQQIRTGLDEFAYISEEELGQSALVDIPEGQPVMYNMVTTEEFDKDTRKYEIAVANLMTTSTENDIVDVRVMFPNGEDYIILSQKKMEGLNIETNVFTCNMNEEEILRMASATIDAYTISGAYIYVTKYIASEAQDEAIPNYPVKAETLELINSDPNVLTTAIETLNLSARLSLESRLSSLSQDELAAVVEGHNISDPAGGAYLGTDTTGASMSDDSFDEALEDDTAD